MDWKDQVRLAHLHERTTTLDNALIPKPTLSDPSTFTPKEHINMNLNQLNFGIDGTDTKTSLYPYWPT